MKIILARVLFGIELILCLFIWFMAVRFWLYPIMWGWPSEVYARGVSLTGLSLLFLFLSYVTMHSKRLSAIITSVLQIVVICITLLGCFMFLPASPWSFYIGDRQNVQHLTEADFEKLAPCNKVEMFSFRASFELDPRLTFNAPDWMVKKMEQMSKEQSIACISEQIRVIASNIDPDRKFDELSIRRIYALVSLANLLDIQSNPEVLAAMKFAACDHEADPYQTLRLEYYARTHDSLPDYFYDSPQGLDRLSKEVCEAK